jgi:hypothetical protein
MAYARGYNPMAARGAEMQTAEARSNIRNVAEMEAEQEKMQALDFLDTQLTVDRTSHLYR